MTTLAASYARAVRAPIETVGADVIVQITGDIPPKLEGLVFPHPNALVPADAVAAIRAMEGVISVTRGVYMWAGPLSIGSRHRCRRGLSGLACVPPDRRQGAGCRRSTGTALNVRASCSAPEENHVPARHDCLPEMKCAAPIYIFRLKALADDFSVHCSKCGDRGIYLNRAVTIENVPERRKKPRK